MQFERLIMTLIIESITGLLNAVHLSSEFIPHALSLVIKYTEYLKTFFGNFTSEHLIVFMAIILIFYFLHSIYKSTKQSLPKPRGKK